MHYRVGREGCAFDGEKGDCETKFDIDIEREGSAGGRQIRHAGYERVMTAGQIQIGASGGNAERGEIGMATATVRRKATKKDRRKNSREIEEAIARVEARFAAINMESSRRAAIGDSPPTDQACMVAPGPSDNGLKTRALQTLLGGASDLDVEAENQMSSHHNRAIRSGSGQLSSEEAISPYFGSQVPPGNAYIGYQFSNEVAGHEALSEKANLYNAKEENDRVRQFHAARLSCEPKGLDNYIGTTKYYPGQDQYKGASRDEMIANVKYKPDAVVPKGPKSKQERSVQFRGAAQQFISQMRPSNIGVPALGMDALPVDDFRCSQSTLPGGIGAATRRPEPQAPPADSMGSVDHPVIYEGETKNPLPSRPYHGPAIVSSDMASYRCA
ncbi:hypothetical protein V494_05606 [Pseudogymnoascus sp. VKM F-4513 (FW-928)]|nr:hypothetical protein V494_05606 [Pseudogymnoascus sp. VKM F-4513 (FW-928)]